MIRTLIYASGVMALTFAPVVPLHAEQTPVAENAAAPATPSESVPSSQPAAGPPSAPPPAAPAPLSPQAEALRSAVNGLPAGTNDEERNERTALVSFYETRGWTPLWLTSQGELTPKASQLAAEVKRAAEWGLDPRDFSLPPLLERSTAAVPAAGADSSQTPEEIASAEIGASLVLLKYARYARGGRIINPSEQLSSYLDRRPQLLKPSSVLEGAAAADRADAYLRSLHPPHPQFEMLRQKYLALTGLGKPSGAGKAGRSAKAKARRVLANMEEWRWMPIDMGAVYIWNNIPDFTQRVIKDGNTIRKVRIVAGETDKQTAIFSRRLRKVTFKPTWIVPDSIKVRELWPSLLRGGGLMRQWSLQLRTKEGQPLDWRRMNWRTTDIRLYDVIQENGPKSVLGKVKFSFPSQHTIFMHDTMAKDKWMFRVARRTYSHGCMRVANPMGLAQVVLREDKGWDAAHVNEVFANGPLNNEIAIEHSIPVHVTYFTAIVDKSGRLRMFPDVYGHERRVRLALEGKWSQIVKGRNHLAPVRLSDANVGRRHRRAADDDEDQRPRRRSRRGGGDFFSLLFGDAR
jgi:murein L,D-transpeptidase YcbB/YkuD